MNTLSIDTKDNKKTVVILNVNGKRYEEVSLSVKERSESVIKLIDKVVKKANISLNKIDKINVEKGPGSFTGLRVGISIANALSFSLLKSVNDKKIGEIDLPSY